MSRKTLVTAVLVAFSLMFAASTQADTIVLTPIKDNTLYEDLDGFSSNGSGQYFFAGNNGGGDTRRGLVAFNVAGAIPAGSTIQSATLTLRMSRTRAGNVTVALHRVLADWGEGTSDPGGEEGSGDGSTPGDATWLHRFFDTSFWSTPGGDYTAGPSASRTVGGTGAYPWTSTGMAADVQSWLDSPANNFGWAVIGQESGTTTAKRFDSRNHPTAANRPQLSIVFTPPNVTGGCCLAGMVCSVLTPAQCSSQSGTYQGNGASCSPNPCVPQTGACCADAGTCSFVTQSACSAGGGTFQGVGSDCMSVECPIVLEPFVDPLPIPAVAQPTTGTAGGAATYDIAMTEFSQPLHRDLPPTKVWGYGGKFPGPTIETTVGQPITVNWINDLRDGTGALRTQHYLPVDPCPHGAHMPTARTVVHLHGGHVEAQYDGYPESTVLPGQMDAYQYPNNQLPATLWYHDHALGITRLNVYMGLAGFYLIRDATEAALGLPSGPAEIPLVVQDRKFNPDGSPSYPATLQDHFFGDKILVNGKVWPYLNVKQGKYRFRLLNGSNSRTYTLSLSQPGMDFTQIGTDGGLMPAPLVTSQITLGPAERADVVVDFAQLPAGTEVLLVNSAPAPFPGTPGTGVIPDVMKFVVQSQPGHTAPIPAALRPIEVLQESNATVYRDFELRKFTEPCAGSMWMINGLMWDDIVEYPELGETEVWRFINRSGISHPMHMHLVMFQILDRQPFTIVNDAVVPSGPPVPPAPEEVGWKDTAMAPPNEITRVIARFEDYAGKFAYHCHILEHEDHEMMRQFQTVACGNGVIEPTEGCDDSASQDADGCSMGCDVEQFLDLAGAASGGTITLTVAGEQIAVGTSAGQTPEQVAAALAAAINANTTLAAAGVTAQVVAGRLVVVGVIENVATTDPGLTEKLTLQLAGDRLWWSSVGDRAGHDVVRGDLGTLRASGFGAATQACLADNRAATWLGHASAPAAGEGFWYLVRKVGTGGPGSYDSGGIGQIAPRDGTISASSNACP